MDINFEYNKAILKGENLELDFKKLLPEIIKIKNDLLKDNDSIYAALNLPGDKNLAKTVLEMSKEFLSYKPTMVIVVGIGGSNMGTEAVINALKSKIKSKLAFYSVDTVDTDYIKYYLNLVEQELERGNKVIINIVTKSGTTTETLVNAAFFVDLLKKNLPDYKKYIVVTTDKHSPLWYIAKEKQYTTLEIPKLVGGRFSVLSAVGLFPCALLGLDIAKLQEGALDMLQKCLSSDISSNYAATSAIVSYQNFRAGKDIINLFLFDPSLLMLGNWYRQLIGESLGKKHNLSGDIVRAGITPIVSIGTTDLHSATQLYLGGPNDKLTTFVSVGSEDSSMRVPLNEISEILPYLPGKSVKQIKDSTLVGVKRAYQEEDRPFTSVELPQKDEYYIGQFLVMKMLEVIYLASFFGVNPFGQPAVESYKNETRDILSKN